MEKGVIVVGKVERIWKVRKVGFIIKLTAHFIGKLNYTRSPPPPKALQPVLLLFPPSFFPPLLHLSLTHTYIRLAMNSRRLMFPPNLSVKCNDRFCLHLHLTLGFKSDRSKGKLNCIKRHFYREITMWETSLFFPPPTRSSWSSLWTVSYVNHFRQDNN